MFDPVLASGALDFDEATVWDDLARSAETDVHLILGSDFSVNHRIPVGDPFDGENCARGIEPGTGIVLPEGAWCQWWELRDPDGAFREDADRLGLFDDGWFDVSEWSLLLADRLEADGQDPKVTYVEGLSHGVTREEATLMAPALIDVARARGAPRGDETGGMLSRGGGAGRTEPRDDSHQQQHERHPTDEAHHPVTRRPTTGPGTQWSPFPWLLRGLAPCITGITTHR